MIPFKNKVDKRYSSTHPLTDNRCCCGSDYSPLKHTDKQKVQNDITATCHNSNFKSDIRSVGGNEKALKGILKDKTDRANKQNFAIQNTIVVYCSLCAEKFCNFTDDGKSYGRQYDTENDCRVDDEGKILSRSFFVSFSQSFGNYRTSARTENKPYTRNNHQSRHNQIDRGKGLFANKVRYEKTVYYAVYRCKNHHNYRR